MKNIFLLLIILLVSCSDITGNVVKENIPEDSGLEPKVYFCKQDNCEKKLTYFINKADNYVYCALFDLDLPDLINLFIKKSKEIDVKLVIDNNNQKGLPKTKIIRYDTSSQLSHNKFCVIDDKKVWTGSFNPTERGNFKNDNNAVVFYSKYFVENYKDEFDELWNGNFGEGNAVKYPKIIHNSKLIENYFCPEDNCEQHVIEQINKANKTIYFMTFSFTSEAVADAILFKDNIKIKGVFEKLQAASQYSQYKRLKDFGLNVKIDSNKYNMHHKVFIIDEETVITGSYNPTGAGNYKNDENILIIHDKKIAEKYLEEFDRVWFNNTA